MPVIRASESDGREFAKVVAFDQPQQSSERNGTPKSRTENRRSTVSPFNSRSSQSEHSARSSTDAAIAEKRRLGWKIASVQPTERESGLPTKTVAIPPSSLISRAVDYASAAGLLWYAFSAPYLIAFDETVPDGSSLAKIDSGWYLAIEILVWLTLLCNAALSSVTSFTRRVGEEVGQLERSTPVVLRHYLRHHAPCDLVCMIPFEIIFPPSAEDYTSRLVLLWKLTRLYMCARVGERLKTVSLLTQMDRNVLTVVTAFLVLSFLFNTLGCMYWTLYAFRSPPLAGSGGQRSWTGAPFALFVTTAFFAMHALSQIPDRDTARHFVGLAARPQGAFRQSLCPICALDFLGNHHRDWDFT